MQSKLRSQLQQDLQDVLEQKLSWVTALNQQISSLNQQVGQFQQQSREILVVSKT